jgi:membrane-bound lytic murein transglycosylase D
MRFTLVLIMSLMFLANNVTQAQGFRFPAKVRTEGSISFTYEALEAQENRAKMPRTVVQTSDEEYRSRVEHITDEIPMKFTNLVKSHVKAHVTRRRSSTEKIIKRSMVYFPIFEETFTRHNMPTDLKYLSIVESALNPRAVSPVGATGLWQFMKPTGQQYKLRINSQVDERRDPYAATDAAARYLADLYERYNDWNLAIAAYNCGPGRIDKAVKKSGKSDYWASCKYLPKETQNYVPAFIGVAYAMNYYHLHNIYPEHPQYELQILDKIRVFDKVSFDKIAQVTGLTKETIHFLNPALNQSYVPSSKKGHIVCLPLTVMASFRAAVEHTEPVIFGSPAIQRYETEFSQVGVSTTNTFRYEENKSIYAVQRGDNLGKIAQRYNVSVNDLRTWNNIKGSLLQVGQQLVIVEKVRIKEQVAPKPTTPQNSNSTNTPILALAPNKTQEVKHYKVKRGESLWSIASKNQVKVQDLLRANKLKSAQKIEPGMQLIIPTR